MKITDLFRRTHDVDSHALEAVTPLIYDELKKLAASQLRHEPASSALQTTVLVHEAFLKMTGSSLPECQNRSHFMALQRELCGRFWRIWYVPGVQPSAEWNRSSAS
jgi:hypothetical protein